MSRENNKLFNNTEKDPTDSGMLDQIKVVIFGDRFSLLTFTEGDSAKDQGLSFKVKNGKIFSNGQELATGKNIIGTKTVYVLDEGQNIFCQLYVTSG